MYRRTLVPLVAAAVFLASAAPCAGATTERVSIASDGTQANGFSGGGVITPDGRFVAFHSAASNLAAGDTFSTDAFVHDRLTGVTERVSVASDGTPGNFSSGAPSISADGRFVAFLSDASNLVAGDTNFSTDAFVHDRLTGVTERVSVASDGTQGDSSAGGNAGPSISADGRFVTFESDASNLVSGDTNRASDVFVHDRLTGVTERVSVGSDGTQGNDSSFAPSISADGCFVAFYSSASNLVSGDTNGTGDVFVHDRLTGVTERVSVASDGTQGNRFSYYTPSISADGRFVAFASDATNLVSGDTNGTQIFVHDRLTGTTERVSVASDGTPGNGFSFGPSISPDGRFVAFDSVATNLVSGDTNVCTLLPPEDGVVPDLVGGACNDVFVHDRLTGATERVSVASDGTQGNGYSAGGHVSTDGHFVVFTSKASNLVSGDTNTCTDAPGTGTCWDVFVRVRDLATPPPPATGCASPLMGASARCTILALEGASVAMTGTAGAGGDVCIAPHGRLTMSGSPAVSGSALLASGATLSHSGATTVGGSVSDDVDLSAETDAALGGAADAAAMPCTQSFASLSRTTTITGTGGLNVVCVGDVDLSGNATISLSGASSDAFVLNVTGTFRLSGASRIRAAGGLLPAGVLYNIQGMGPDVVLAGATSVDGTLLAPDRTVVIARGRVNGQVIAGESIRLTGSANVGCQSPT